MYLNQPKEDVQKNSDSGSLSPQGNELRKILLTRYFGNQKLFSKLELGGGNSSPGGFVKPSSGGEPSASRSP